MLMLMLTVAGAVAVAVAGAVAVAVAVAVTVAAWAEGCLAGGGGTTIADGCGVRKAGRYRRRTPGACGTRRLGAVDEAA